MSAGRVMQGAHFLSHNLWTLLIDWMLCLACYRLVLYRRAAAPVAQPIELAAVRVTS
jgi:membrane-associated PAP2 superfamily phosphatase